MKVLFVSLVLLAVVTTVIGSCSVCEECRDDWDECSGLCKCDGNCVLFGDCCESEVALSNCTVDSFVPTGVEFVCRSIYPNSKIQPMLNEAFWMVSSCPDSWSTDVAIQAVIRDNCSSLSSSLPPVTDLDTGTVYANEFCAVCNRIENILAWQPGIVCAPSVYDQLNISNNNISQLLEGNPTIFQNGCLTCSYQVPGSLTRKPRSCFPTVSTCASMLGRPRFSLFQESNTSDSCTNGPYDIVVGEKSNRLYRNEACARCNSEGHSCFASPDERSEVPEVCIEDAAILNSGIIGPSMGSGIPFTIFLSNLGNGQVEVSILSETVTLTVNCPEGQAALGLECRPTLCPEGYVESGGQCAFVIKTINSTNISSTVCLSVLVTLNFSDYTQLTNDTVLFNDQVHTVIKYDSIGQPVVCANDSLIGDSIDCPNGLVALNVSEFTRLSNYTILFGEEVFDVIQYNAAGMAIICPPNSTAFHRNSTTFSYPVGYFILTYVGCFLSVIGCALVLLTYGLFKSLRTLPSLILINLVTAILTNNLLVIIGGPVTEAFPSKELCTTVAVCLHFSVLAEFTWMVLMSFQMAKAFYQARKMIYTSKHSKHAFCIYFIIGWSIPLLITTVSIIVDFTTDSLVSYGVLSDGRLGSCWINHAESAIVAFIVPLVLTMVVNLTLFIVVTVLLCLAARSSNKVDKKQNLYFVRVNAAVFSVTGLTWIFCFVALLANAGWAWYLFIIFNSTQGFSIFIAFLFTKHVLKLYWNLLLCRKDTVSFANDKSLCAKQQSSLKVSTIPSSNI